MAISDTFDRLLQQIVTTVIFILFLVMMFRKATQKDEKEEEAADEVDNQREEQEDEEEDEEDEEEDDLVDEEEEAEEIQQSAPRIIVEEDAQSVTESDIMLEDEMTKELHKCTCRVPLRMHRLAAGKYRISGSKKTCLVRILKSVVMVRVGGGWVTLEEFLTKHDPCRAKLISSSGGAAHASNAFKEEMMAFKAKRPQQAK